MSQECIDCPAGYACDVKGIIDYDPDYSCEEGSYCDGAVSVSCPEGTYNPRTHGLSNTDCLECPAGYLCDQKGIKELTDDFLCPLGFNCKKVSQFIFLALIIFGYSSPFALGKLDSNSEKLSSKLKVESRK
jgi:hypothetical protein